MMDIFTDVDPDILISSTLKKKKRMQKCLPSWPHHQQKDFFLFFFLKSSQILKKNFSFLKHSLSNEDKGYIAKKYS